MEKIYFEGFSGYVRNALYHPVSEEVFFLELTGLSGVDAICAGILGNRSFHIQTPSERLHLTLFRWGKRFVTSQGEEEKEEKSTQVSWRWKTKSHGPIRHAVLYPEDIFNAWRDDAPFPRVIMGRSEEEARDNLWRFLQLTLGIPVPEGRNLPFLMDLIEKAFQEGNEEVLRAIFPLASIGRVKGWLINSLPLLEEVLQKFYAFLIKKGEIPLQGKEVSLQENTLEAFLEYWGEPLTQKVLEAYKPLYKAGNGLPKIDEAVSRLLRKPFPAQREAINSLHVALFEKGHKRAVLCGEQGTGKTLMALALIGTAPKPMRVLVVCPPHLVPKWAREAKETIPGVKTITLQGKDVLKKLEILARFGPPRTHEIWVIGREKLKLSFPWRPAVIPAKIKKGKVVPLPSKEATGAIEFDLYLCPECFRVIYRPQKGDEEIIPADWKWLTKARRVCSHCKTPLWQPDTSRFRRYSPAEFIKKRLKGVFDLLVVDECHEYKAQNTAQANSVGALFSACKKALLLTGTLMGGYASDVFYLYFRAFPRDFRQDGWTWSSGVQFQRRYGILEEVEVLKEVEDNRTSRGRVSRRVYLKQRPGVSPEVLARFLLPHTIFVRLEDMASELPPYEEVYLALDREDEDAGEYEACQIAYEEAAKGLPSTRARLAIASKFVSVLMNLPDCVRHLENEIWQDVKNEDGKVERKLLHRTQIVEGDPLAKERWLADLIKQERRAGRKVLVYCTYTGEKDITRRLASVLAELGVKAVVLPASVSTDRREEWIRKNTATVDALICNPKLVETGLDLFDFPTVVFYQPGYRVYTLRQAARRSWRLGQKHPVRVYFLAAQGTVQEDAWALIAQKWAVSAAVEGELVTDGFATEFDATGSILGELARKLEQGSLGRVAAEAVFRRLKETEVGVNTFLTEEETRTPGTSLEVQTTISEVRKTVQPRTIVFSVLRKKGRKSTWVRMEVRPEDFEEVKKKFSGPIQRALF